MIISHNMAAMNSRRQLEINTSSKANFSEKLASGFRINRAADDAAGLSISEKMRSQIRGLNRASDNAQDGISLIQTAEGALSEVHGVLQRMNELAVQAANDTNTEIDRQAIQQEMNQLRTELNRISDTTTFNTRLVLKAEQLIEVEGGSLTDASLDTRYQITTQNNTVKSVYGITMDFANVKESNISELVGKRFFTTCTENCAQIFTFEFTDGTSSTAVVSGRDMTVTVGVNDTSITDKNGKGIVDKIIELVKGKQSDSPFNSYPATDGDLYIGHANGIISDDTKLVFYSVTSGPPYAPRMGELNASDMLQLEESLHFQVGAKGGQVLDYTIKTINTDSLKLNSLSVASHEDAVNTMTQIQDAINFVSEYRSYLGAKQNRLEHIMKNLDNTAENTQAAESVIRDTDMASEMVELSKSSILEQVAQSMLAQSNMSTQGVLSLLQ